MREVSVPVSPLTFLSKPPGISLLLAREKGVVVME